MTALLVVVVRCPGLPHRLAHEAPEAVADSLRELWMAAQAWGEAVAIRPTAEGVELVFEDARVGLEAAFELSRHRVGTVDQPGVGIGRGYLLVRGGVAVGLEALRARLASDFCRVGEIFCTDATLLDLELPPGVGRFVGPAGIVEGLGYPVHALRDYRGPG